MARKIQNYLFTKDVILCPKKILRNPQENS